MSMKIALQLYSIRDQIEKDFFGSLKSAKEMGYDGVEFAGLFGQDPIVVRDFMNEIGLIPISAHVPLTDLIFGGVRLISDYKKIGCKYIAIPYLPEGLRPGEDGFENNLAAMRELGYACSESGIQLLYHNHDFEFNKVDGEYGLDMIYRLTKPEELMTEIDTCWVSVAGENPAAYIRKYKGRSPVVHLKDYYMKSRDAGGKFYELIGIDDSAEDDDNFTFMPVGYGLQDMKEILKASEEAGAEWVVVEQDRPDNGRTPMQDALLSIEYLKKIS